MSEVESELRSAEERIEKPDEATEPTTPPDENGQDGQDRGPKTEFDPNRIEGENDRIQIRLDAADAASPLISMEDNGNTTTISIESAGETIIFDGPRVDLSSNDLRQARAETLGEVYKVVKSFRSAGVPFSEIAALLQSGEVPMKDLINHHQQLAAMIKSGHSYNEIPALLKQVNHEG